MVTGEQKQLTNESIIF